MKLQTLKRRNNASWGLLLAFIISVGTGASLAYASATSGTITQKYAWSNVGGWVNFGATNGGVTVTDSGLTGYAWSANDGWINLAPSQSGVKNDGAGNLSGFAWDTGAGWVNFSGVTIDTSGKFHGTAVGGTVNGASYAINFSCTYCDVETDWRPASVRTTTTTTSSGSISPVITSPSSSQTQTTLSTTEQPPGPPPASSPAQNTTTNPPPNTPPPPTVGSSGNTWQNLFPWLFGKSAGASSSPKRTPPSAHAPTTTPPAGESSGAKFVQAAAVPVSIIAIALFVIFLIRFFL